MKHICPVVRWKTDVLIEPHDMEKPTSKTSNTVTLHDTKLAKVIQ